MTRLKDESRKLLKPLDETISYCSNCGSIEVVSFSPKEFVLVKVPGARPYYGRLMQLKPPDDSESKPIAIISVGGQEMTKVQIDYLVKVGD